MKRIGEACEGLGLQTSSGTRGNLRPLRIHATLLCDSNLIGYSPTDSNRHIDIFRVRDFDVIHCELQPLFFSQVAESQGRKGSAGRSNFDLLARRKASFAATHRDNLMHPSD